MINGDPKDFIEVVYSGQDIPFLFRGQKFWFNGYNQNGGCHMEVMECFPPYNRCWEHEGVDYRVCGDAFQQAPMFFMAKHSGNV